MQPDPFGNLRDWGPVLELIYQLSDESKLSECQPGLTRILRYRDNWRLREETLNRIGKINKPDNTLVLQVLDIIKDENLYYEVRILACETLMEFMKNGANTFENQLKKEIRQTVGNLQSSPHPPIFEQTLKKLYSEAHENFSIA